MESNLREILGHFSLPRRISRLPELAYNLWWVGRPEAQYLFSEIDHSFWEKCNHNPVAFLRKVERPALNAVVNNRYYLDTYDHLLAEFDRFMKAENTWFLKSFPQQKSQCIAYFSFEFGLHECLPVYAGGLGVLSGDHLKESSDLGLPMVGVGFIYNQGYFSQHITEDGWQETGNYKLNFDEAPICAVLDDEGKPAVISVTLADRKVYAKIWKVQVGRVPLYLLDSNVEQNNPLDRQMTDRLYSNDPETRISQEILLGMGGVRALRLLGYNPTLWHMNEGHSAFLVLERIREYVAQGMPTDEAHDLVRKTNIFTTHTPVPAGNDQFPMWLMDKYFFEIWPELQMTRERFVDLGRHEQPWGDAFSMPVLALRFSNQRNAVSELHGQVSRRMWNFLFPDKHEEDVPITHITNGVHTGTWQAKHMCALFSRYLGEDWIERMEDLDMWAQVDNIPDKEIWDARIHLKRNLMSMAAERSRQVWLRGGKHPVQIIAGGALLDWEALTIGFARRFATYKRGYLIMHDYERLLRIINRANMPVQIIFAGKAHPSDEPGKLVIQQVYRAVKDSRTGGRLVFLEDYDMNIARYMVQGVDIWMNTPRRPNEASGTSGMKAAINGALNFSVLDGWWHEGYNTQNGWAIGGDEDVPDPNQQDSEDAASLYNTLENEIAPLYYRDRTPQGVPTGWVAKIKESLRTLVPQFSMQRMIKEYTRELYLPAMQSVAAGKEKERK